MRTRWNRGPRPAARSLHPASSDASSTRPAWFQSARVELHGNAAARTHNVGRKVPPATNQKRSRSIQPHRAFPLRALHRGIHNFLADAADANAHRTFKRSLPGQAIDEVLDRV